MLARLEAEATRATSHMIESLQMQLNCAMAHTPHEHLGDEDDIRPADRARFFLEKKRFADEDGNPVHEVLNCTKTVDSDTKARLLDMIWARFFGVICHEMFGATFSVPWRREARTLIWRDTCSRIKTQL